MRADEPTRNIVSNGYSTHVKKVNGQVNGVKNGRKRSSRSPLYRSHNREEVTRILIQGLRDMGYENTAASLSYESGFELESSEVSGFRNAILNGEWLSAERFLSQSGLVLAEHASRNQMLFFIREQKFLEMLVARDLLSALKVLREELTPLHYDTYKLHRLSTYLMCTQRDLETQLRWPDPQEARQTLLEALTRSISPSVMIRDHRLSELLDQVKSSQINQCTYHNTALPPSLYSDHHCNQHNFPTQTWMILENHTGEVYCVAFSPDGTRFATAGQDTCCVVYDTNDFSILYRLLKHGAPITHIAWSPDSKKLLTTATEAAAYVWDMSTGKILATLEHQTGEQRPITSGAWTPDSKSLITCCHDINSKLCLWNLTKDPRTPVYTWSGEFRVSDIAISADGQRLGMFSQFILSILTYSVCNDMDEMLIGYDIPSRRELWRRKFSSKITSITASQDARTAIVNIAEGEVHMIDLNDGLPISRYRGPSQGAHIIRNCYGGAAENFVLSGSEGKSFVFISTSLTINRW